MPVIRRFDPRELGPKPWGRELLVASTEHYTGKVLWMNAGKGGAFQYHRVKDEAFYLFSGTAVVKFRDSAGDQEVVIGPGDAYHVPPGAPHQVTAITNCVFFEASTPAFDDRVAVE